MSKKNYKTAIIIVLIIFIFVPSTFASSLRYGAKGVKVKEVQQRLSRLGYNIKIDSIYGDRTEQVVKLFQSKNGLTVDGIAGNKTFELLKQLTETIKYTVKKGDCLSKIALIYNSSVEFIKNLNDLGSDKIYIGQKLLIPKTGIGGGENKNLNSAINYEIQRGDTLSGIARKYGINIDIIKKLNNLNNDRIYIGQSLLIPLYEKGLSQSFNFTKHDLIWPAMGRISSGYGYRSDPFTHEQEFHGGIDIAVPMGTKVRAVASGTVVWSGWAKGFGKTIVIDHGNKIKTLYGHNSKLIVPVNTRVNEGKIIALSGSTGRSTGPHLDFRIYINGHTVDPEHYLR